MATSATHIPVEVYLQADYEHDCDYVNGVVEERPVGGLDHSAWQAILVMFFGARQKEWGIYVRPELRVCVYGDNFRVPDVCLLSRDAPVEQVITHPPLAVFEILSPDDRMVRVMERLADYEMMGIEAIWVIDPEDGRYLRYVAGQLVSAPVFTLPGSEHQVALAELAAMRD